MQAERILHQSILATPEGNIYFTLRFRATPSPAFPIYIHCDGEDIERDAKLWLTFRTPKIAMLVLRAFLDDPLHRTS